MGLSNEERTIMVQLEMERAQKIQTEFPIYQQNQLWSTLANRMYYALYHASMSLLIANGLHANTHQGVYILLSQHFIKEGKLSKDFGNLYTRMQNMREKGDYNCLIETSPEELLPLLPKVETYISTIQKLIEPIN